MNIQRAFKKVIRGIKSFCISTRAFIRLATTKTADSAIFLTSYAIGDVVYGLAYIKEFKQQHPGKRIVVIADPMKKFLVESYTSIDEVLYYKRSDKFGYEYLVVLNGSAFYSFLGKLFHIYNTLPCQIYGYKKGKDCLSLLRRYFKIENSAELSYPACKGSNKGTIANFEANHNKVVIVNPYMHYLNESEMEKNFAGIISYLQKKEYIIYTNVIGEQKALPGTTPLNCSLEEFVYYADRIPLIISARSGIMDLVVDSKAEKIIIYPKSVSNGWRTMFEMKHWGKNNLHEVFDADFDTVHNIVVSFLEGHEPQ